MHCQIKNNFNTLFRFISIPSKTFIFVCQTTWFWWNVSHWTSGTQRKLQSISAVLTLHLKEFFTFSVKNIYQLNYFICIKDFNSQTITSLKSNLFYFFIYCCQHHERKTSCLDIFLLSDRQWGTEHQYLPQPFSWHLHITITYNLPHLRLYVDVVTVIA